MAQLRVGVAPGTTTLRLGQCGGLGRCIPPMYPVDTAPGFAERVAAAGTAQNTPMPGPVPVNPYGSEVELKGTGLRNSLGLIMVPYGYKQGQPPWEITAVGYGQDRLGCDPKHFTRGEQGYYSDTSLGEPDYHALGRGMPTDAELSINNPAGDYMPILRQMLPTADGRMVPLPWIPPNGWNEALAYGPQPYPPGGALGMADVTPSQHQNRMFVLQAISTAVSVIGFMSTAIYFWRKR